MPRIPRFPPMPKKAHSSGQARVKISGHHHYLGKFGSPEADAEYHRLYGEWRAGRLEAPGRAKGPAVTVADVVARFYSEGERDLYKGADGAVKAELGNYRCALAPLIALYGHIHVAEFTAQQLKTVRGAMASGEWGPAKRKGWCRNYVNRSLARVKLVFGWAESENLAPKGTRAHLDTVPGLTTGRHGVRETDDVAPAREDDVAAALPHMNHVVRALVELLLLTAARPKELRLLRPCDIAQDGRVEIAKGFWVTLGSGVWAVDLKHHKTSHKKKRRVILFGPKGQAILAPFLEGRAPDAYLFSPREAMEARRLERRANRKSGVQPSQEDRRRQGAKRHGDTYSRYTFRQSVEYACLQADKAARKAEMDRVHGPLPSPRREEGSFVQPFFPYALRHLAAVRIVAEFDWSVAQIVLGHTDQQMTARYGSSDFTKAAEAQGKAG